MIVTSHKYYVSIQVEELKHLRTPNDNRRVGQEESIRGETNRRGGVVGGRRVFYGYDQSAGTCWSA